MSDDIQFNHICKSIKPWFDTENEAWLWYKQTKIPSFGMTPEQVVNDTSIDGMTALEEWIKAKKFGGFE